MGQDVLADEVLKEKTARRAALRTEYWKQVTNPHRHGTGEGGHIVSGLLGVTSPLSSLLILKQLFTFSLILLSNDTFRQNPVNGTTLSQRRRPPIGPSVSQLSPCWSTDISFTKNAASENIKSELDKLRTKIVYSNSFKEPLVHSCHSKKKGKH